MTRIHEGMPDIGFTDPATLDMEAVQICRKSGKLAIGGVCDADPRGSKMCIRDRVTVQGRFGACNHFVTLFIGDCLL